MEQGRSSQTAMLCAMLRAAHVVHDTKPCILYDDLAAGLAGFSDEASLNSALHSFEQELAGLSSAATAKAWMEISRLCIATRTRYAEDELETAVARGVSQYVVLGAGFDSLAYRRRDLADRVRIFEVDHPVTQEQKRNCLERLRVPVASNVTFVPVDFEMEQSAIGALQAGGYRHDQPAFFSWLGVVWYLTDESIDRTFREIASAASGSEVVLDYLVPQFMLDGRGRQIVQMAEAAAAARREQGGRYFEPAHMAERLRVAGFSRVRDSGAAELNARYFCHRADGLQIPRMMHLVSAQVT